MYESFYGLTGRPFSLLPDAEFLYLSEQHRKALNLLEYGMMTQAGFIVITGEIGAGKTTIVRRFLKTASPELTLGIINNTNKGFGKLLTWVAMAFDLDHRGRDYVKHFKRFQEFLLAQYAAGKRTVLIIDEAQNMTPAMLEELRMLSNINNEKDQLLQMVLVGQPELLTILQRPDLVQFVQRIAVHYHLTGLDRQETANYIHHRLGVVGGRADLFDPLACTAVHYFTGGVPRLINLLCDVTLVYGFASEQPRIDFDTVIDAVEDRAREGLSSFKPMPDGIDRAALKAKLVQAMIEPVSAPQRVPKLRPANDSRGSG
jgi:type II secretory pathway predicted ATPase ExeA